MGAGTVQDNAMYMGFYKFHEHPFGLTPDPRTFYYNQDLRETLASLSHGIEAGVGLISLVAEPGLGKTTILLHLLESWRKRAHTAFLFHTQCTEIEFVRYLLDDLQVKSDETDAVKQQRDLRDFLCCAAAAGQRVIVCVDEAHNLSDSVLETVRLLSNCETGDRKLIQFILSGQPLLAHRLARKGLAGLQQRIGVQLSLAPLNRAEVEAYVTHRLQLAGYHGSSLFSPGALRILDENCRGIPRLINNFCFNALSLGCTLGERQVSPRIMEYAVRSLQPGSMTGASLSSVVQHAPTTTPEKSANLVPPQRAGFLWKLLSASIAGNLLIAGAIHDGGRFPKLFRQSLARTFQSSTLPVYQPKLDAAPTAEPPIVTILPEPAGSLQEAEPAARNFEYLVYEVKPHDTLRSVCLATLNRYDSDLVAEIHKLNPEFKDPRQLSVGQKLRLPSSLPR